MGILPMRTGEACPERSEGMPVSRSNFKAVIHARPLTGTQKP